MGRRALLLLPGLALAVVATGCVAPHGPGGYGRYYDPVYVGSRHYAPARPVIVRPRPVIVRPRPVIVRPRPVVVRPAPVIVNRPVYRAVKPPRREVRREWVQQHRHERPGYGGKRTGHDRRRR